MVLPKWMLLRISSPKMAAHKWLNFKVLLENRWKPKSSLCCMMQVGNDGSDGGVYDLSISFYIFWAVCVSKRTPLSKCRKKWLKTEFFLVFFFFFRSLNFGEHQLRCLFFVWWNLSPVWKLGPPTMVEMVLQLSATKTPGFWGGF